MSMLEQQWDQEMRALYEEGKNQCGYRATYFLQMVSEYGGVAAAHLLLRKDDLSEGIITLWRYGRLDLTMEARMFQRDAQGDRKWQALFTPEELETARLRLVQLEYRPALDGSL